MCSRQDEERCRCAYNTSLNSVQEAATCGPPPPPPPTVTCCTTAPAAQQVAVGPCGTPPPPPPPPTPRPCSGHGERPPADPATVGCANRPNKSRCRDDDRAAGSLIACDAAPGGRCGNARPCGGDPCGRDDGPWTCDPNVCVRPYDGCGGGAGPGLTPHGRQFVACTDRVAKKCACVKFNGLQDSCNHPDCCVRKGCLDKPFPTCLPARKWRFKNVCCRDKMKKKCKPDCN